MLRVIWTAFVAFILPFIIAVPLMPTGIGLLSVLIIGIGETSTAASVIIGVTFIVGIFALPLRWWLRWSLAIPVTVLEGGGLRASMRRSKAPTYDRRGRIFVIYC